MTTPGELSTHKGRLRWQCRRALLELDLVLERFLARDFDALDDEALGVLAELLALDDYALWALVNGSQPAPNARWQDLLAKMNEAAQAV